MVLNSTDIVVILLYAMLLGAFFGFIFIYMVIDEYDGMNEVIKKASFLIFSTVIILFIILTFVMNKEIKEDINQCISSSEQLVKTYVHTSDDISDTKITIDYCNDNNRIESKTIYLEDTDYVQDSYKEKLASLDDEEINKILQNEYKKED